MGALVGLLFGLGAFLVWRSFTPPAPPRPGRVTRRDKVADQLAQAGVDSVTPGALVASCLGTGLFVLVVMYVVSRSPAIAFAFSATLSDARATDSVPTAVVREPYVPRPIAPVPVSPCMISTFSGSTPSLSATTWAIVVSWPWPCGEVPV